MSARAPAACNPCAGYVPLIAGDMCKISALCFRGLHLIRSRPIKESNKVGISSILRLTLTTSGDRFVCVCGSRAAQSWIRGQGSSGLSSGPRGVGSSGPGGEGAAVPGGEVWPPGCGAPAPWDGELRPPG